MLKTSLDKALVSLEFLTRRQLTRKVLKLIISNWLIFFQKFFIWAAKPPPKPAIRKIIRFALDFPPKFFHSKIHSKFIDIKIIIDLAIFIYFI